MDSWVISFVGFAALYGSVLALAILGVTHRLGRCTGWRALPFLALTLSFFFLTQHPFPNPGTLICPVPSATPQMIPFRFLQTIEMLRNIPSTTRDWLTNLTLVATTMNFVICAAIGLALTQLNMKWRSTVLFACALTTTVELTQLTGFWGLYPCAYRQFNVDDLLMNFLGVCCGALLMARQKKRRRMRQIR